LNSGSAVTIKNEPGLELWRAADGWVKRTCVSRGAYVLHVRRFFFDLTVCFRTATNSTVQQSQAGSTTPSSTIPYIGTKPTLSLPSLLTTKPTTAKNNRNEHHSYATMANGPERQTVEMKSAQISLAALTYLFQQRSPQPASQPSDKKDKARGALSHMRWIL
jgi:hypothetical protein